MKKYILYEYLGTNGIITSPIHLEDVYYVRKVRLIADKGKALVTDADATPRQIVVIPEADLDAWREIDYLGQE